jgi:hypothetical protein
MRVCCPIHGPIELGPASAHVACTSAMLRLDGVRQLGGCAYVYPSATHTRRAHSLGVAYLSRVAGERLRAIRPDLVSAQDVARLEMAGLVHDLGHGPFSHLFEVCFPGFSHEEEGLRQLSLLAQRDHEFVALAATYLGEGWEQAVWAMMIGDDVVDAERAFLYQVVHAHASGIDTDKLDYLARDSHTVFGTSNTIAIDRILNGMRIVGHNGRMILAFDERVAADVFHVYRLRASLHRQVYQHRSTLLVESLLCDALRRVDDARVGARRESLQDVLTRGGVGELVDAMITADPSAKIELVARWKAWRRVDATVPLRTSPHCGACGGTTLIVHRFCQACGAILGDRPHVGDTEPKRLLHDELCSTTATRQVHRASGHDVRVTISDVHGGAHCVRADGFGGTWHDWSWDTIPIVRDGQIAHDVAERHQPPGTMRWREAACYAAPGTSDEAMETIKTAFLSWGQTIERLGVACELAAAQ